MILFIDKPAGITSFDVIRILRRTRGIHKIGHAGTLDPFATGLLILATDADTKKLNSYMGLQKTYEATLQFGATSSTYDREGKITPSPQPFPYISRGEFELLLKEFIGTIAQTPPQYSAKKINGVRACDLARKGQKVVLAPVLVTIFEIAVINWDWPRVSLFIRCGKGTYIRSMAHDIGSRIGCGAYLTALRRTAIGEYVVADAEGLL